MQREFLFACVALLGLVDGKAANTPELVNDRAITIRTKSEVEAKRNGLIRYLWGGEGFPTTRMPDRVLTNVHAPVKHLHRLARVDELRIDQLPGLEGLAYHFIPEHPNDELVVLHHGHGCTMDDDPSPEEVGPGLQRTLAALLSEGYGVLGVFMPHMRPGDCTGKHETLFSIPVAGNPIRLFLDPVAAGLNYLERSSGRDAFPHYKAFHMVGLSGGGWTTTVYAAVDTRISFSFPVAGTIPLYLRSGGSVGDREQYEPSFYRLAGYPDLYVLGSEGLGRKQVQILNRLDDCCFGQAQHKPGDDGLGYPEAMFEYEHRVQAALETIGNGTFELIIDEVAPSHMISHHAIDEIIVPELRRARARK
ncbi:MAG: hypothetical protein AB9869_33605 [Verrucomicrobiia bacterium]